MDNPPKFKKAFIERYEQLTDFKEFKKFSLMYLRRSIRVNTLKITVKDLVKRLEKDWKLTPVPWCKEGFWIKHRGVGDDHRRDVGNLVEHALGYFYLQEATSMIPPVVLDPQPGETILDMCASPGSKTTQIGQYMKNTGLLIANDITYQRMQALGINVQRIGLTNTIISMRDGWRIKGFQFDRVLCDAPCSGTGTIRKSFKTLRMWNPNMVKKLSGIQKQLLKTAFANLKVGGTLVYSTCTMEPHENEAVVSHLLDECPDAKVLPITLDIIRGECITSFEGVEYHKDVSKCLRINPQDNDTGGFFVCKIQKVEK